MSPSLQKKLKNIESFLDQLKKHHEKVLQAIQRDDRNLVIYYRKEIESFVIEIEKILESLNKHKRVGELRQELEKIKKILDDNFKNYE